VPDIKQILQTYSPGSNNNFTNVMEKMDALLSLLPGTPNLIFMSDGYGKLDATVAARVAGDIKSRGGGVNAFAIGEAATITTLQKLDPEAIRLVDIEELANIFLGFDDRYAIEPWKEGVSVYLDLNDNGTLDAGEPLQTTQPDATELQ
jgi:large repetitive protein